MKPENANRRAYPKPKDRPAGARPARRPRSRRKTFKQAVPAAVQARLDDVLRQDGRSPERLAELYKSHALDEEFGVTLAQFRRYADGPRSRASSSDAPEQVAKDARTQVTSDGQDAHASFRSNNSGAAGAGKLRLTPSPAAPLLGREAFHRRMKAIGEIVDSTFGALATHQPDLWGHGAYLMLVGSVVACLAERHAELSTSELATLSKILAEQRSLTLKQAEADRKLADRQNKATPDRSPVDDAISGDAKARKLPAHFGDVVRQIYGTSFQDDFTVESAGHTSDSAASSGG